MTARGCLRIPLLAALLAVSPSAPGRAAPPVAKGSLLWPLEIPGTLLSSFGEYRYDHLHAGVDISTAGGTGYRVRAAGAGLVFRLKVEWRGYGRALYQRLPDGRIAVYGHLERFEDAVLGLEKKVRQRQVEARTRYPGDLYLDPPVPVRRGQTLAFSGESGVGLPHLHFEVRDAGDRPIDPFVAGLPHPEDKAAPVPEVVTIEAAAPETFIEGNRRQETYPLERRSGVFVSPKPIRVSGPFLASLSAFDPAGSSGRSGLREIAVKVDGADAYGLVLRAFAFDQYPLAGLIYDHRGSRLGPARFSYRLTRLPGNALATAGQAEVFDLRAGPHRIDIDAIDAAGNRALARLCILVGRPGRPRAELIGAGRDGATLRFAVTGGGEEAAPRGRSSAAPAQAQGSCLPPPPAVEAEAWDGSGGHFIPLSCRADEGLCRAGGAGGTPAPTLARVREQVAGVPGPWAIAAAPPGEPAPLAGRDPEVVVWPKFVDVLLALSRPGDPGVAIRSRRLDGPEAPLTYRDGLLAGAALAWRDVGDLADLEVLPAPAAGSMVARANLRGRIVTRDDGCRLEVDGISVEIPPGGRFFPGPLVLRSSAFVDSPGLPGASPAVDLEPGGEALERPGAIRFRAGGPGEDLRAFGIYRWDSYQARWSYEGGDEDRAAGTVWTRFRRYGRFALLRDASPPVLLEVLPADGARGVPRRGRFQARVEEIGEGLDFDGVAFSLDEGPPLESEFDPDRGLARVLEPPVLQPGPHRLTVTATDRAGNVSAPVSVSFVVR